MILFDNRGAGESECPPPPWTVPDMAADAIGVLDALGIARAHVLGVSMGGMIAQEMAIRWPERVDRLVVAVSFARPDPLRRAFLLFRRWARLQGADLVQEGVANLPWLVSPRVLNDPDALERILGVVGARCRSWLPRRTRTRSMRSSSTTRCRACTAVRAPTLVLAAAEDVLTPVLLSREIATAIPGARLTVLPRGSHAVQIEDPEAFNAAVLELSWRTNEKTPMAIAATRRPAGEAGTIGVRWLPGPPEGDPATLRVGTPRRRPPHRSP